MFTTNLIVVFGVSGVGKTKACIDCASQFENVEHVTASRLLSLTRLSAEGRTELNAASDQQKLVGLVNRIRFETEAKVLLLDAHSIIFVSNRKFIIPSDIIVSLSPNALVFLRANPEVIVERRTRRGDYSRKISDLAQVNQSQLESLRVVEEYSRAVNCPLFVLNADRLAKLDSIVEGFF